MDGRRKYYYRRPFAGISRSDQLAAALLEPCSDEHETTEGKDDTGKWIKPLSGDLTSGTAVKTKPLVAATELPVNEARSPMELMLEASVTFPKLTASSISIMRFHHGVDHTKWQSLKMAREDNTKTHQPFAAKTGKLTLESGSEYSGQAKEQASRRKYECKNKYQLEEQPWVMTTSSKQKFRGVKEGGISNNAAYFIMKKNPDGTFEALPVSDWYNFKPAERLRALNSEQVEEQFDRRKKVDMLFPDMIQNRMKTEDTEISKSNEPEFGKSSNIRNFGLKLSKMDDWDDSDNDEDDNGYDGTKPKWPNEGKPTAQSNPDEDSDAGDDEGRDTDYNDARAQALENSATGVIKAEPENATNLNDSCVGPDISNALSLKGIDWRPTPEGSQPKRKSTAQLCTQQAFNCTADGITEETVRRYLLRKPFTVTELVRKFKSKMCNIDKHEMINVICRLLKKIDPARTTIKGTLYLSLPSGDTGQLPGISNQNPDTTPKKTSIVAEEGDTISRPPAKVSRII